MSWKRYIEATARRVFGPRGLGVASGLVWVGKRFHAKNNPTVLVVTQTQFEKDIAEIDREGSINWLFLPKRAFGKTQKQLLPNGVRSQRFYYPSLSDLNYRAHWRQIEKYALGLLDVLRLRWKIDAVLSAHVDYWQDEGLRRACARRGIPFLVLCQENYNIPKTYRTRREEFRSVDFRFGGTAIATFSEGMRDLFVQNGICSADRVVVTGAPRLDGWQRTQNRPGPRIIVLSFLDSKKYYASSTSFFSVLDALIEVVSATNVRWELIVKCKNPNDQTAIRRHLGEESPVQARADVSMPELLSTASIVVGGSSLSTVESLLSGAEVVVPILTADTIEADTQLFDPSDRMVREHINFVRSIDELKERVGQLIEQAPPKVDRAGRLDLMRRYIAYTDGQTSGHRVAEFIKSYCRDGNEKLPLLARRNEGYSSTEGNPKREQMQETL